MLKPYKRAFTLAETIMTLFIVGLVVTAAIPMFTQRRSNAPATSDTPWTVCQNSANLGLCTANDVVIGGGTPFEFPATNVQNAASYGLTLRTTDNNLSPYDLFHSDRRSLKIGNMFFNEGTDNLVISKSDTNFRRINKAYNIILDTGNSYNLDTHSDAYGTRHNISIGNSNELCIGQPDERGVNNATPFFCENNVILGNNNKIGENLAPPVEWSTNFRYSISNSIIFGSGNTIGNFVNASAIVGNVNRAIDDNYNPTNNASPGPSVLIGFGLNDFDTNNDGIADSYFSIGDHIYGTRGQIIINGNLNLASTSSLTVDVPYTLTSDERLKNIQGSYNRGLKEILQVQPIVFAYKSDPAANENIGVIAQDVQKVFPEAVITMPSGYLGVDSDPMFFAMINSLKEINANTQAEINRQKALKDEIAQLKSELEVLTACKANTFAGRIKCFIKDLKRFFINLNFFAKGGNSDAKA